MEHAVMIVGAGPVGTMLAAELALAGVSVAVVDRRPDATRVGTRARGLHARTIEVFDQRGIVDRFLDAGTTAQVARFGEAHLDISDFPTRHPYGLALAQNRIERILAEWTAELGVRVQYGREVIDFEQDDAGIDIHFTDGPPARARYLVGCDGGRSLVRRTAGITFPGSEPTISHLLAEVELAEEPQQWGFHHDSRGRHALSRISGDGPVSVMITEREIGTGQPTLRDLSDALVEVYGTDFGAHSPSWLTRFTDASRQASTYRAGRVLLAGDAAHVHYPAGGQGLNIGVQDAVNLGWKLAQVVAGASPVALLDTYQAERHPIATRVVRNTMAAVALNRTDDRTKALGEVVSELLLMDEPRRSLAGAISGLDVHYDLGPGHPLKGRRMPDLDVRGSGRPARVFSLLDEARPVLLRFAPTDEQAEVMRWADRVRILDVAYDGTWELPVLGVVSPPTAVLIRPDGHVAWVGEGTEAGLEDALTTWFGVPATT